MNTETSNLKSSTLKGFWLTTVSFVRNTLSSIRNILLPLVDYIAPILLVVFALGALVAIALPLQKQDMQKIMAYCHTRGLHFEGCVDVKCYASDSENKEYILNTDYHGNVRSVTPTNAFVMPPRPTSP